MNRKLVGFLLGMHIFVITACGIFEMKVSNESFATLAPPTLNEVLVDLERWTIREFDELYPNLNPDFESRVTTRYLSTPSRDVVKRYYAKENIPIQYRGYEFRCYEATVRSTSPEGTVLTEVFYAVLAVHEEGYPAALPIHPGQNPVEGCSLN